MQRDVSARRAGPPTLSFPLRLLAAGRSATWLDLRNSDGIYWNLVAVSGRSVIRLERVVTSHIGYLNRSVWQRSQCWTVLSDRSV
jgi:hypothetical protein